MKAISKIILVVAVGAGIISAAIGAFGNNKAFAIGESFSPTTLSPSISYDATTKRLNLTGTMNVGTETFTTFTTCPGKSAANVQVTGPLGSGSPTWTITGAQNLNGNASIQTVQSSFQLYSYTCQGSGGNIGGIYGFASYSFDRTSIDVSSLAPGTYSFNLTDIPGCVPSAGSVACSPKPAAEKWSDTFTIPPTSPQGSGALTVQSVNASTGEPVPSSWNLVGTNPAIPNMDVCGYTSVVCSGTTQTYSKLPAGDAVLDQYHVNGIDGSAGPLYAFGGTKKNSNMAAKEKSLNNFFAVATNLLIGVADAKDYCGYINPASGYNPLCPSSSQNFNVDSFALPNAGDTGGFSIIWSPIPAIKVTSSPSPFNLDPVSTTSGTVTIQNVGASGSVLGWSANTTYTIGGKTGWLAPEIGSGNIPNGSGQTAASGNTNTVTLSLVPDMVKTMAKGTYQADVHFEGTSSACKTNIPVGNCGSKDVTVTLTVPTDPVTVSSVSVTVSPDWLTITGTGGTVTGQAKGIVVMTDGSTTTDVTYSSDNGGIASVDGASGLVTGHTVGTANITATSNIDPTKFGSAGVTVSTYPDPSCVGPSCPSITGVTVTANPTTIASSKTATCTATVTGSGSYNPALAWSATNGSISGSGNTVTLAPTGASTATCKATSQEDASKSGSATVNVTSGTLVHQPTCSMTASPTSVVVPGASILSYSCTYVQIQSCSLSGGQFGSSSPIIFDAPPVTKGSISVSPTVNTIYGITCKGSESSAFGSGSAQVIVTNPGRVETSTF